MSDKTRRIPTRIGEDGVPQAKTKMSPTENTLRVACKAPPHTVVPVIFLPGIMGSNLRDARTKKSVWGVNSMIGAFFQWAFRSSSTRQRKLNPENVEVDPGKSYSERSATITTEKMALARGMGEVSKASYAKFLHWLDDRLNVDCSETDSTDEDDASPWKEWEDRNDIGREWNAEKTPFLPITEEESMFAWNGFYCPVYAKGYNWIKSNGDSGQVLAEQVQTIIDEWNTDTYKCEKVILVTHSMGGLVARAAVHPEFGNAADKVLGIIHGVMPATGAPAAYHHVRSGYDFPTGIVLGSNAAQVTAVIANSPGALELLPTQDYPKGWLQARARGGSPLISLPEADPYSEIYSKKEPWWRLIDPKLIDPAGTHKKAGVDAWHRYEIETLRQVADYHFTLSASYHPQTYVHYGADSGKFVVYNTLVWESSRPGSMNSPELLSATPMKGSDPVTARSETGKTAKFEIVEPDEGDEKQAGDGTVPAWSGEAPHKAGGGNVKQSFCLNGFGHQPSYDNATVRDTVLHSIGKLLQQASEL